VYQTPNARLAAPSTGAIRAIGRAPSVRPTPPDPAPAPPHGQPMARNRGEQQHADARTPAGAVHETDRERTRARARPFRMAMRAESPPMPPHEQRQRESDNERSNRRLRSPLDGSGQVRAVEHDRKAEGEERRAVTYPPCKPEPRCGAPVAGGQGRDRREMVGIGGVPEAEEQRDAEHDEERRAVRRTREGVVEPEHLSRPLEPRERSWQRRQRG